MKMKKFYTKLLCSLGLLICLKAATAQTNIANYQFARTTGTTYTPISGGTVLFTPNYDDNVSTAIPLGGSFTFGGVAFTQCYISSNGFITFGTAAYSSTTYTPLSTLGAATGVIAAFAQDGAGSTVSGAAPEISYLNIGGATGEFVVQYKDHADFDNISVDKLNFQIRLNLATNAINVIYGSCTNPGPNGTIAQVGLRGNTTTWTTNVNNLLVDNIPAGTTCNWADAVTGNANNSGLFFSATNVNVNIPNGLRYTWVPATTPAPVRTFKAATNLTINSATVSWATAAGATQYNVQYRIPGTCAWTNYNGNPVADTSVNFTNLAFGTSYQVRVQSVGTAGNSIWSHIPTSAGGTGTNGYTTAGSFTTVAACNVPTNVTVTGITTSSAVVNITSAGNSFIVEYGLAGFTPGTGATPGTGGTIVTTTSSTITLTGLTLATTYDVYVRQNCTAANFGYSLNSTKVTFFSLLANDNAAGAFTLTVGAGCTGAPYTNEGATLNAGEPYPSCSGAGQSPVWFKFVAPASGAVRVSTDLGTGQTFTDSKIALFSATNPADYTTFSIISCDDDGGSDVGSGFLSVLYATGLTAGTTYYVAVDKYLGSTLAGTFCIAVDELNTAMLAATNNCASNYQKPISNGNSTYTGWVPLLDGSSRLIALVRSPAGVNANMYSVAQNINTGAVRQSSGTYYLNRNFQISNTAATNVDVRLFFLNTELTSLATADPAVTLANLGVTRQAEAPVGCYNNYSPANGAATFIPQTGNGTASGVNWISFTTSAFSNFYLNRAGTALPISLQYLKGQKTGTNNVLDWKVNCTSPSITMELERSSDSRTFKTITSIVATQARCSQPFDYTDASPLKGTNYYRLKMIDIDGKATYSPIVAIINSSTGAELVGIYPTVVQDEAFVSVAASRSTKMQLNITDMSGRIIKTINQAVASGSSLISINTATLSTGVYNITGMLDGVQTKTLRFVKQ